MAYVSVEMKCANFDPCLLGEKGRLFESVDETYAGVELKAGLACIGIVTNGGHIVSAIVECVRHVAENFLSAAF